MKRDKLASSELQELRNADFRGRPGFVKAETVFASKIVEAGTPERAGFDAKARAWHYSEVLRHRCKEVGMTQKELAEKNRT